MAGRTHSGHGVASAGARSEPRFSPILFLMVSTGQIRLSRPLLCFWVATLATVFGVCGVCASAKANWARCTFSGNSIESKSTWVAGTDAVNLWFGLDWGSGTAGYADLAPPAGNQTRTVMQAMPVPPSGTYSISVQVRPSQPTTQTAYWHVLAVMNGVVLSLGDAGVPQTISQVGVKSLYRGTMPTGASANNWNTYTANFTLSSADAAAYQYVVIALVGASPTGQTLWYDNIHTSAPVASTASAGLTCKWITHNNVTSVTQLSFSSPIRTSFESEVYWIDTRVLFYPGGPLNKFGMELTGTITIPSSGNWTFTLGSDDGSRLKINGSQVILNDGAHSFRNRSATVNLNAGTYPIEIVFFENGGSHGLQLRWQGPGMAANEIVPWTAFVGGGSTRRMLNWTSAEPGS